MKREPVVTASALVGVIMSGLAMLVALGVIRLDPDQMSAIETFLVAAIPLTIVVVGGLWARSQVTPLVDPRDKDGQPLVRGQ